MKKMKYVLLSTLLLSCGLFTSCNKVTNEVMIVGVNATDFGEIDILVNSLGNKTKQVIDGVNFYSGRLSNKRVVIAESKFGMSESAMATTIGIKHFHPKMVINEGTSGAHHGGVHVNDIVLGQDILDMSSYHGEVSDPSKWDLQHDPVHSDQTLLEIANSVTNPYGNKKYGIISSSNCWNTEVDFVNKLHAAFNEDCEEMENYGVISVCNNYNIPALAIRIISNNLITGEPYNKEAGKNVQRYTMDVLKAI